MSDSVFALDDPSALRRFPLGALLGEGADSQAFLAADSLGEVGEAVVKRPHPSLVSRGLHDDVERRMMAQARFRREYAPESLPRLLALTRADGFAWHFGDDLGSPYMALAEERARGVPLIGGVADEALGRPVGLPLSLFALHRPTWARTRAASPALVALGVIERCAARGLLALDLGPRNVFYAPADARTTVIDLGNLAEPRAATRRREALDVNDVLLEFFAAYTTPNGAPRTAAEYLSVREVRLSGGIERRSRALADEFAARAAPRWSDAARRILDRLARRAYESPTDFRADFLAYSQAADDESSWDETQAQAWREALGWLRAPYWRKFAFDADAELEAVGCA